MVSNRSPHFDVIIIGAGPAGTVAATMLARAKFEVALIEQSRFPRDKVCGECISAVGLNVLRRHDLLLPLQSHAPSRLTRAIICAPDGSKVALKLPREMAGLSRLVMDQTLLSAARNAGTTVYQPARVESLDGGNRRVVARDLQDNRLCELQADLVLLADGKGTLSQRTTTPTGDLGIKCHLRGVDGPRDAIELFGVDGHYTGLAPIEDDLWNLAFSIPVHRVAKLRGDHDALLNRMRGQNKSLAARLRFAERASDWLTSSLPRFPVASHWEHNVIPLGNAAAALEPIGGEGMGLAMKSAEIACDEIITARLKSRAIDVRLLRTQFNSLWRLRRFGCRSAAMTISSSRLSALAVSFLGHFPRLHQPAMNLIGKL